ncbi:MAG: restriction endonuclease subunit S [Deltaproteobacteria bacterium]|jgi:type I restriction enzyme S subunit|nr:restriction endonuclease subunit S [Deltaproteobacteria bacterium]
MELKEDSPVHNQVKAGYKQTEIGVIPEDWDVVSMGTVGESIIGLTYSPNDVSEYGTLVLRSSNVQNNQLAYKNNVFVDMDLPSRVIVKEDDILICVRNGSKQLIGKCALIDKKATGSAFGAFMSIYRSEYSRFIFFVFQYSIIQGQINEVMGATINQITNKDLAAFKIPLPPNNKAEQTAIASVLSDADALIQSLEKLIAKKRLIKQGAMQKLLKPKEGWVVKKLGEIVDINMGQSPDSKNYNISGKGLSLIQGNADIENRKSFKRVWTTQITKTCKADDLIMTVRAPVGSIGIASDNSCIGRGVCSFEITDVERNFLYHLMIFRESDWKILEQGSTFTSANSNQISNFELSVPRRKSEQTRIATILSDMDAEIFALETKLSKHKQIKQGMMQELLTGKIRLV